VKNRFAGKYPKIPVTKAQKDLISKLERAIVIANNTGREELAEAAEAVLEFLPHCAPMAIIFAEIYKLSAETIQEIKETFHVNREVGDS